MQRDSLRLRTAIAAITTITALALLAACSPDAGDDRAAAERSGVESQRSGAEIQRDTARVQTRETAAGGAAAAATGRAAAGSRKGTARVPGSFGTTAPTHRPSRAGIATVQGIRAARQPGFERIVVEMDGEMPGYDIAYAAADVTQCGSGEAIVLGTPAVLELRLEPAAAHTEAGEATRGPRDLEPSFPLVRRIRMSCDFEAHVGWAVGLARRAEYRVMELRHPTRLVIDLEEPARTPR